MIFSRKKRRAEATEADDAVATATAAEETAAEGAPTDGEPAGEAEDELAGLDAQDWRTEGPWDITEVDDLDGTPEAPRIDLGSLVLTGVPGSELRLQIAEETSQIVSAMLVIQTLVEAPASAGGSPRVQSFSSGLELGAYAAPRSGGLWAELRDELSANATEAGGSASFGAGPFGVELRRLIPVTSPEGEQGYQPSRMWVVEGPRWLLRGIVYGQAAIEDDPDSAVVADVAAAFRQVVVRRGDEPMAPGDLLPLEMPADLVAGEGEG